MIRIGRFSHIWLQDKYEFYKKKKTYSYIFGYGLEPGVKIWRFFKLKNSNYGYWKSFKALDFSICKFFNTAFWLYIASKENKKRLSPVEKRASKILAFARGFFHDLCAQAFFLSLESDRGLLRDCVSLECGYLRNSKFCVMRRFVHCSALSINLSIFSRVNIAVAYKEEIGCYDTSYVAVVANSWVADDDDDIVIVRETWILLLIHLCQWVICSQPKKSSSGKI